MSKLYRLMIYFGVATFLIYSKEIDIECETVSEFREKNPDVVNRVFIEGRSMFEYEMSFSQMNSSISAYMAAVKHPQAVTETEPYKMSC